MSYVFHGSAAKIEKLGKKPTARAKLPPVGHNTLVKSYKSAAELFSERRSSVVSR